MEEIEYIKTCKNCGKKLEKRKNFCSLKCYHRNYYKLNRESILKNQRIRRTPTIRKEYYLRNKDKIKERAKIYKKIHRENYNRLNREYYKKNKEKVAEWNRKSCFKHKEKRIRSAREYHRKNREKCNETTRKWRKAENSKWKLYIKDYWDNKRNQENERRKTLGIPLIGEGWNREKEMKYLLSEIFKEYTILIRNRSLLIDRLELDFFIKELNLAFEVNGEQHYNEKECQILSRGRTRLEQQQYRDRVKKKICKIRGIKLIIVKYNEKISKDLILNKLNKYGIKIPTSQNG